MVCSRSDLHAKEVWVRLVRLPLHLWEMTLFKYLGDCCESFVAVDEDIVSRHNLQWTRILVRLDGKKVLGSLQVVVGRLSTIRFSCGGRPRLGYLRLQPRKLRSNNRLGQKKVVVIYTLKKMFERKLGLAIKAQKMCQAWEPLGGLQLGKQLVALKVIFSWSFLWWVQAQSFGWGY